MLLRLGEPVEAIGIHPGGEVGMLGQQVGYIHVSASQKICPS